MDNVEQRAFRECRAEASDNGKKIRGYAIVFDSPSIDLGGFIEEIAAEAVDRTLNEGMDVRALIDHKDDKVLGRTRAGTLSLRKDSRGLRVEIEPDPEISYVHDLMRSVARGDVSGMSFRFINIKDTDKWDFNHRPLPLRRMTDMIIREISVVTFPAYQATDVSVAQRSLQAFTQQHPLRSRDLRWLKLKLAR